MCTKKGLFRILSIVLVLGMMIAALPVGMTQAMTGTTRYVNLANTASTTDWGVTQFSSIQAAINAASAGDTIVVKDGTYNATTEGGYISEGLIKVTKPVTIKAEEDGNEIRPVIDGTGNNGIFKIHGSQFSGGEVRIKGFKLLGNALTGTAITNPTCDFDLNTKVVIDNNSFEGMIVGINFWGSGFCVTAPLRVENVEITNNEFNNLGISGIHQGVGILLEGLSDWDSAGGGNAAVVSGNTFTNILANDTGSVPAIGPGLGLVIWYSSEDNQAANANVSDNTFTNVGVSQVITDTASGTSEFHVANGTSIQTAIDVASAGDTILVGPGTYDETGPLTLDVANLTVQSIDGASVTTINVQGSGLYNGVEVLANLGDVTFKGFTVVNFTQDGIKQAYTQKAGTRFHVINNVVTPQDDYLRNGIEVTGDGSTVVGNTINGMQLTPDWASCGIQVDDASNAEVLNNKVIGDISNGVDFGICVAAWDYDIHNVLIQGNEISKANSAAINVSANFASHTVSNIEILDNTISNSGSGFGFYSVDPHFLTLDGVFKIEGNSVDVTGADLDVGSEVKKGATLVFDASPNWWGSAYGPEIVSASTSVTVDDIEYIPWCADSDCLGLVSVSPSGEYQLIVPEGATPEEAGAALESLIDSVSANDTVIVPAGNYTVEGGFDINQAGVTIILEDGVFIQNNSPCFNITASYTTVTAETPGLATCVPTLTDNGINVAADLVNVKIEGLNIDGSQTTGNGIEFAGPISDVYILNNYIHDFGTGKGVYIATVPGGFYAIEGNLFKDNVGLDVDAPFALDVSHNAWGSFDGPVDGTDLPTGWTYTPYTHVGLYLVPSESSVGSIQLVNGTSMSFDVMADLTNVFGLAFDLNFPSTNFEVTEPVINLTSEFVGVIAAETPTYGDMVAVADGVISFDAIRTFGDSAFTAQGHKLFTFTVDAEATGKNLALAFAADPDGFAMMGADYTNLIIPAGMSGEVIDVITLPDLTTTLVDTYFKGIAKEFTVAVSNPAAGGSFVDPYLSFVDFGNDTIEYTADGGTTWSTVDPSRFDISDIAPSDDTDYTFRVTFNESGPKSLVVNLFDKDGVLLDTTSQSTIVYTLPTLTSDDLGQDYYNTYPQEFTITVNNPIDGYSFSGTKLALSGFTGNTKLEYWNGVSWETLTLDVGEAEVLLDPFSAVSVTEVTFRVTFNDKGDYNLKAELIEATPFATLDGVLDTLDETVTVNNTYAITGSIAMQGRSVSGGVPVTLTHTDTTFGSWLVSTINQISDNLTFLNIPKGVLTFTTNQPRYLNVIEDLNKVFVLGENLTLPRLVLKGGNAVQDNIINLSDAATVGMNYGLTDSAGENEADVNFDKKINIQDLALVGGNYQLTSEVAYASWPEVTSPELVSVTPTSGNVITLGLNESFVLTVQASDDNLYELEIDHSMSASLPEFSVYASESDPFGGDGDKFAEAGVTVVYVASTQTWTIDFGPTITASIAKNGSIDFYLVLKDIYGNQWGTMYGTTPENTFSYTFQ